MINDLLFCQFCVCIYSVKYFSLPYITFHCKIRIGVVNNDYRFGVTTCFVKDSVKDSAYLKPFKVSLNRLLS